MKINFARELTFALLVFCLILIATRPALAVMTSTNWAGYVVNENGVTAISASWNIPPIQCSTSNSNILTQAISVWIGFDGFSNEAIPEQLGTDSGCFNSTPYYVIWEEDPSLGTGSSNYARDAFPHSESYAEDRVTASITYLGNNHYQLVIADMTQDLSRTYTVTIPNTPRTSAEWIAEVAFNIRTQQQLTLPGFQPITFSDCSASVSNVAGSIIQNNGQPLDMVDSNGNTLLAPQNLNQAGTSFQVAEVTS